MSHPLFPIKIHIKETQNVDRKNRPIRLGIPFPKAAVFSCDDLELTNENRMTIPFQAKTNATWHDGSIRWLLIDFNCSIAAQADNTFSLIKSTQKNIPEPSALYFTEDKSSITVNTGRAEFIIDKHYFLPFKAVRINQKTLQIAPATTELTDQEDTRYRAKIQTITFPNKNEHRRNQFDFKGYFESISNKTQFLNFNASLTFFSGSSFCELDVTLHNPNAAKHSGGFWDMGDEGSVYFKSFVTQFDFLNSTESQWKDLSEPLWQKATKQLLRIYQDSSGGERWNHHLHIDKDNHKTVNFKGYHVDINHKNSLSGQRISPLVAINDHENNLLCAYIKQFWQNFPKAVSSHSNQLKLELFPCNTSSNYELQAGEKKTHSIILGFNTSREKLEQMCTPLNVTLTLSHYVLSTAMPGLIAPYQPTNQMNQLIAWGINGKNNFFDKREKADEYGWRHFGELWADHETLEHGNNDSLVSHYNNQYDPIYGFTRQYLLTSDSKWWTLLDDLTKHVIDIDIYHTNKDRPEYNNGLFWHTDHYLDGRHCTHRTFSKKHMEVDHVEQSGGGPGSEHCYTTGLMYHYFLSGNERSKEAVLQLAKWAKFPNEGTGTLIERIFDILKKDIPKLKRLLKKKYVFKYTFPLSRGTGNYINTLLDSFTLTQDASTLKDIVFIITNTLGPNDNLKQRQLMTNIELNWHYTVLLQSVIRFIEIKESIQQLDDDYQYALQAFLHYAHWVFENEKPYLENADLLVYPNDTWVAQDTRKVAILNAYLNYCPKNLEKDIHKRSLYFIHYIEQHFIKAKNHTTRIQALLMQNYSVPKINNDKLLPLKEPIKSTCHLTISGLLITLVKDLLSRLFSINLKREYQWLSNRLR